MLKKQENLKQQNMCTSIIKNQNFISRLREDALMIIIKLNYEKTIKRRLWQKGLLLKRKIKYLIKETSAF